MTRKLTLFLILAGCPTAPDEDTDPCIPDGDASATDVLPVWGTSVAAHPLLANSPFVGTLTYETGETTEATVTTAYRDVVIEAFIDPNPDPVECEPVVEFTMDITLTTADGAFDETLEANLNHVWIHEGTLLPTAVNEAVEGTFADIYSGPATSLTYTSLHVRQSPTDVVPNLAEVSVGVDGVDYDLEQVGTIVFE